MVMERLRWCFIPIMLAWVVTAHAQNAITRLDAEGDTTIWRSFQSAGVTSVRASDAGYEGRGLRFDVQFPKGSGYGGVFRTLDVPVMHDFQIMFWMRATVPVNNFEIKVSDDTLGENVWWVNHRMYTYPTGWKKIVVKRRHLSFAWGPRPADAPARLRRIEVVVTAGSGGEGSVWIDDLSVEEIPVTPAPLPRSKATASHGAASAGAALPGAVGAWAPGTVRRSWWQVDWGYRREFGGIELEWGPTDSGLTFDLLLSNDGKSFDTVRSVEAGGGGRRLVFAPESEARYMRVYLRGATGQKPPRLWSVDVIPAESLSTRNHYVSRLAGGHPRGVFPRGFAGEQSYWTVVGVPESRTEALIDEDGAFEVDKQSFSLEPFVWLDQEKRLLTWADGPSEQWLESARYPIPSVRRMAAGTELTVTLLATGAPDASSLAARYVLRNGSASVRRGQFWLAVRPFQVNPPSQWLNFDGGATTIRSIRFDGASADVDGRRVRVSGTPAAGATTIDADEVVTRLAAGSLPEAQHVVDATGFASGAFGWPFMLAPGESLVCVAAVPWTDRSAWYDRPPTVEEFGEVLDRERLAWRERTETIRWSVPPSARHVFDVVHATLGYILVNRDGSGFQPGSRSYERSWMRDGTMTSDALLKFGMPQASKEFIEWIAPFQYESGMVPCVVDARGPDPVPEHDSNGQLIFGIMQVFRFTHDTTFLRRHYHHIVGAVDFIQSLRAQRMTPLYKDGDDEQRAFYGLVTESISHEGYSAKPMHSYWDNFFVLRGLKDAAAAAAAVGDAGSARSYDSLAIAFRGDLYRSIALAMKNRRIDYIPGCVELGDFDATSTSIGLYPGGEFLTIPAAAFRRTFDRYFEWFMQRARGEIAWDAYTPYEVRNIGTFVYLGQKERAHALLDWFMRDQRPAGWNHWAEVVVPQLRTPRFIGDMPHTWVGSDFLNAVRSMFVYERDDAGTLVVGAGLRDEWVREGIGVSDLPTHWGTVTMRIETQGDRVVAMTLSGTVDARQHPILVSTRLLSMSLRGASVNGLPTRPEGDFVPVTRLPATVELAY
jgi:hypothetical protein